MTKRTTTRGETITYRFVARGPGGRRVRGTLRTASRREAWVRLVERGLVPVDIRPRSLFRRLVGGRVRQRDLLHTTRQLAVFIRAGVPVVEAIEALTEDQEHRGLVDTLDDVAVALREGEALSDALLGHPRTFPVFYQSAVLAAERTGRLDVALDRIAEYLARDEANRRRLLSAFAYPGVILTLAVAVVIVLSTVVIPQFRGIFDALGTDLPFATWLLLAVTGLVADWWYVVLAVVVAATVALAAAARTTRGRLLRDRVLLGIPSLGGLLRTTLLERFCRSLGSMVQGGVPLPDALRVAVAGTNNAVFDRAIDDVRRRLLDGEGLSGPLSDTGLMPSPALRMIRAGERTATLDRQLLVTADYYDRELEYRLDRFTTVFEPMVLLFAGLVVGFVAVALVSAIYGPLQRGVF